MCVRAGDREYLERLHFEAKATRDVLARFWNGNDTTRNLSLQYSPIHKLIFSLCLYSRAPNSFRSVRRVRAG